MAASSIQTADTKLYAVGEPFVETPTSTSIGTETRFQFAEQFVIFAVFSADVAAFVVAAKLAYAVQFGWHSSFLETHPMALLIGALPTICAFQRGRLYNFDIIRFWPQWTGHLLGRTVIAALLLTASLYLLGIADDLLRFWLVATFAGGIAIMWTLRGFAAAVVRRRVRRGGFTRSVAIVGAGEHGRRLIGRLTTQADPVWRIAGVFDDRRTRIQLPISVEFGGSLDNLLERVRSGRIKLILLALPRSAESRIMAIADRFRELPIDVVLCSDLVADRLPEHSARLVDGVVAHQVLWAPLSNWATIVKRAEDLLIASLALAVLAPLLLAIAIAVKLDSRGPVLFRQVRGGYNGNRITVLKFRSMHHEPNARFKQATQGDSRVTRVGDILRRTSADELPQLFNVLRGTMSLVGPRPHPIDLNNQFYSLIPNYKMRQKVKPGITGLAQINGFRGETRTIEKMQARVNMDLEYIENWSLFFDIRILILTAFKSWRCKNAY